MREVVDADRLRQFMQALDFFDEIEPGLYRFPAVDSASFRAAVEAAFAGGAGEADRG